MHVKSRDAQGDVIFEFGSEPFLDYVVTALRTRRATSVRHEASRVQEQEFVSYLHVNVLESSRILPQQIISVFGHESDAQHATQIMSAWPGSDL